MELVVHVALLVVLLKDELVVLLKVLLVVL